jgi:hypothetical protein
MKRATPVAFFGGSTEAQLVVQKRRIRILVAVGIGQEKSKGSS